MPTSSQLLDRIAVTFDDDHAVAAARLISAASVGGKLLLNQAADQLRVAFRWAARPPRSSTRWPLRPRASTMST